MNDVCQRQPRRPHHRSPLLPKNFLVVLSKSKDNVVEGVRDRLHKLTNSLQHRNKTISLNHHDWNQSSTRPSRPSLPTPSSFSLVGMCRPMLRLSSLHLSISLQLGAARRRPLLSRLRPPRLQDGLAALARVARRLASRRRSRQGLALEFQWYLCFAISSAQGL